MQIMCYFLRKRSYFIARVEQMKLGCVDPLVCL